MREAEIRRGNKGWRGGGVKRREGRGSGRKKAGKRKKETDEWKREVQCKSPLSPILQEASYDYMEKEGERTFLECLDQLEVANARLDDVSVLSIGVIR